MFSIDKGVAAKSKDDDATHTFMLSIERLLLAKNKAIQPLDAHLPANVKAGEAACATCYKKSVRFGCYLPSRNFVLCVDCAWEVRNGQRQLYCTLDDAITFQPSSNSNYNSLSPMS